MDAVRKILQVGIDAGVTPGLAAGIFRYDSSQDTLKARTYFLGREYLDGPDVSGQTIYDLASLTKPLCTTLLVGRALSEGWITLDERPWGQWPTISIESLLSHTSGLPSWSDLSQDPALVYSLKQDPQKIGRHVYSDIGFILLGHFLQKKSGQPLNLLFQELCREHYKTDELYFLENPRRVNDQNCQAMGGIAGHAGLFGTLKGASVACQWILRAMMAPQTQFEKMVQFMAKARIPGPLGFDYQTRGGSTGGVFSPRAVGHLGFTGVSFWLDPKPLGRSPAICILLTNRLAFSDDSKLILSLRQEFHQAALLEEEIPETERVLQAL